MTDGRIPEGRKPLTDADIAALTRRLAGTAVDYKELYEAAKRDAEEAEAYAEELEVKLAKAISAFEQIEAGVVPETDPDTGIWIECNMSEDEMQDIARTTLAELKEDN